jgi:glycosyltransferase involved in cell wall biosynthesis
VVVGSAPYADAYTAEIRAVAGPRVRLLGGVWDQEQLDQLYGHALTYLHGHSVGGTNPSLLRATGAAAYTIAFDVDFNREVLGDGAAYFSSIGDVARELLAAESDPAATTRQGAQLQKAVERYNWDDVTDGYEALCRDLAAGVQRPSRGRGRRAGGSSLRRRRQPVAAHHG